MRGGKGDKRQKDKPCIYEEVVKRQSERGCVADIREPVWQDWDFLFRGSGIALNAGVLVAGPYP